MEKYSLRGKNILVRCHPFSEQAWFQGKRCVFGKREIRVRVKSSLHEIHVEVNNNSDIVALSSLWLITTNSFFGSAKL